MNGRLGITTTLVFLLAAAAATAQEQPWRPSGPQDAAAAPAATATTPQPQVPFALTPQEEAYVDQVLNAWEQHSDKVSTFETQFTRREYDPVFGPKDGAKFTDQGILKYKKPDKGMFRVDGQRPEQWISDGKSIFEFNYQKQQLVEHKLPPEMQGQAIEDGPLPFLFGAKAEKLKRRYWIRPLTPPGGRQGEIWLEVYPRHQVDAANFQRAEVILRAKDMVPLGIQLHLPNGKSRTSYTFTDAIVNDPNPLRFLQGDPFSPRAPLGWSKVVEEARSAQASHEAAGPRR